MLPAQREGSFSSVVWRWCATNRNWKVGNLATKYGTQCAVQCPHQTIQQGVTGFGRGTEGLQETRELKLCVGHRSNFIMRQHALGRFSYRCHTALVPLAMSRAVLLPTTFFAQLFLLPPHRRQCFSPSHVPQLELKPKPQTDSSAVHAAPLKWP